MRTSTVAILGLAVFASGAAALAFETLWFHQAGLALGNGVWASSIVLAGFMAGMALGNLLAARFAGDHAKALRLYAVLELLVASSGVALVYLLPSTSTVLAPALVQLEAQPLFQHGVRFALAFGLLLIPSTALGMTLPLLVPAIRGVHREFGWALGLLYGANTAGAVLGVLGLETLLLPQFGIRTSAWLAAALDVLAAAIAFAAVRDPLLRARTTEASGADGTVAEPAAPAADLAATSGSTAQSRRGAARFRIAAFGSGFLMLGLEVAWLRFEMLFLNDTPLAFALILAVVLAGIAAGGFVAGAWLKRVPRASTYAPLIAYAAGMLGLAGVRLYPYVLHAYSHKQDAWVVLQFTVPLVLPTAFASGMLFSFLGAGLSRSGASDVRATADLAFMNTLGGALGSLLTGFLLLPHAGLEKTLLVLLLSYAALGLVLSRGTELRASLRYGAFALCVLSFAAFPFGGMQGFFMRASASRWMTPHDDLKHIREGSQATLFHVIHRLHGLRLFDQLATNAYSMTVNSYGGRRYMKLFALLPRALHPELKRALLVGYGIGNTAEQLLQFPELERLDIADISKDVLAMSREMKTSSGIIPLDDPRVRVHIEDGRQFLAGTAQRFDLITGEPPPPVIAGVVNLYTREYFRLLHDRLAEGGFATYWLPMMNMSGDSGKAVIRAFCDVFSDCSLWHGETRNFMLMGSRAAQQPRRVDRATITRSFGDPALKAELNAIGLEQPAQLGALFIGDAAYLNELTRDVAPLVDDQPKRMHQPRAEDGRDALVAQWRDTGAARKRFVDSALIGQRWPEDLRSESARVFEHQRLIDDLLYPNATAPRQIQVLHQVLQATPLRFPALLLLNTDPDIQRALREASPAERERPEWVLHRAAGHLAERDFAAALPLLQRLPESQLPLPELLEYVQFVVARGQATTALAH